MPLELGMAVALRHERSGTNRSHNFVVMAPSGSAFQQFVSDLAGFDPYMHELSVPSVIRETHSWLQQQPDAIQLTKPAAAVLGGFDKFKEDIAARQDEALGKINWADIIRAASAIVPQL
jgi:hypothetical protein